MKESHYKKQLPEEKQKLYDNCVDLIERGKIEEAAQELEKLLTYQDDFIPALNKKAVIKIYNKNFNKAKNILKLILDKDPEFAPAVTNLGSIAREMGDSKQAKELYQKALKIDEEYGPAYNNLGVIYREEGNYSESVKYLKKARQKGSISYKLNKDRSFYKDPGCIFTIFLFIVLIIVVYLILN